MDAAEMYDRMDGHGVNCLQSRIGGFGCLMEVVELAYVLCSGPQL